MTDVVIAAAWRPHVPGQTAPTPFVLSRGPAGDVRQDPAFRALWTPPATSGVSLTKPTAQQRRAGALSVQLCVDLTGCVDWREDAKAKDGVTRAIALVVRIAAARARRPPDDWPELKDVLTSWARQSYGERDAEGRPALRPFFEKPGGVQVVGFSSWLRRGDGWEDLGATVMVAIGHDRYGIRVRPTLRPKAYVNAPAEPAVVDLGRVLDRLVAELQDLADATAAVETRVAVRLGDPDADLESEFAKVDGFVTRREALEAQRRSVVDLVGQLRSPSSASLFAVEGVKDDILEKTSEDLVSLRDQIVGIARLRLDEGAWRLAHRSESLALLGAALIPPGIVAGTLGANILPWSASQTSFAPLAGMLLLMLASSTFALGVVRSQMNRPTDRRRITRALILFGAVACVAGAALLALTAKGT
jgi:hypothetical protein